MVFLAQGKFPFYEVKICSLQYFGGLVFLLLVTLAYLFFVRYTLRKRFTEYNRLGILVNLDLSLLKEFSLIALGGFSAGMIQGILGVGSGTFIMAIFLTFNLNPRVASATSGFQVFFIGSASFIEGFITDSIQLQDALLLFGLCSVGGGLVTFGFYEFLKRQDENKVNRMLVTTIVCLCMISSLGVIPSLIQTWLDFGFDHLISVRFKC